MPRPKAPCGTAGAYRRHKLAHERIDDKCQAWKDAERADRAPATSSKGRKSAPKVDPLTLADLNFAEATLESLNQVRQALAEAQPAQVAALTKRKSELLREIWDYQQEQAPSTGPSGAEKPPADPLDALLGGADLSNVTRLDPHPAAAG